jgi:hypothetical protein
VDVQLPYGDLEVAIMLYRGLAVLLLLSGTIFAQRVDPFQNHYRVRVVDKVITGADGIRKPAHASGMLAYAAIYHPNGKLVLVEYVAKEFSDLDGLFKDAAKDPDVKVFPKGQTKKEDVEAAAKAVGFGKVDLSRLTVRVR